MSRYDWMADARCAETDPDLWHLEPGSSYADAKQICRRCPVQRECADHAGRLEAEGAERDRHGMFAGRTKAQREAGNGHAARRRQHAAILRLAECGMEAEEIAEHVGCTARTVWRVQKAHREQMGEAA